MPRPREPTPVGQWFRTRMRQLRAERASGRRESLVVEPGEGISRTHLIDVEEGRSLASLPTLFALAVILEIPLFHLLVSPGASAWDDAADVLAHLDEEQVRRETERIAATYGVLRNKPIRPDWARALRAQPARRRNASTLRGRK